MSTKKTIKFLFTAEIHKLSIQKNIKFLTKIQWKRHTNKTETQLIKHEHGFSIFNEKIQLQINLAYDQEKEVFEDKNTEIVVVIELDGKVKSGGYIKYNIAQIVNNNLKNKLQTIQLTQCPDPNAFVQITFDYSSVGEDLDGSMSVLNVSSRDLNMSRVDFNDDKLSLEINRINTTVNKLNDLAKQIKNKQNQNTQNIPKLKTTIDMLEGEKNTLKKQIETLQKVSKKQQGEFRQEKMKHLKQISELEKQAAKHTKQFRSKQHIEFEDKNNYKQLYEKAVQEIEELKQLNLGKSIGGFGVNLDDVENIANFDNSDDQKPQPVKKGKNETKGKDIEDQSSSSLQKKNDQLQETIADMSYKLAALFNASYEYGGAKLLDHLQIAIGLTENHS